MPYHEKAIPGYNEVVINNKVALKANKGQRVERPRHLGA